jgi:hypothetical protein
MSNHGPMPPSIEHPAPLHLTTHMNHSKSSSSSTNGNANIINNASATVVIALTSSSAQSLTAKHYAHMHQKIRVIVSKRSTITCMRVNRAGQQKRLVRRGPSVTRLFS